MSCSRAARLLVLLVAVSAASAQDEGPDWSASLRDTRETLQLLGDGDLQGAGQRLGASIRSDDASRWQQLLGERVRVLEALLAHRERERSLPGSRELQEQTQTARRALRSARERAPDGPPAAGSLKQQVEQLEAELATRVDRLRALTRQRLQLEQRRDKIAQRIAGLASRREDLPPASEAIHEAPLERARHRLIELRRSLVALESDELEDQLERARGLAAVRELERELAGLRVERARERLGAARAELARSLATDVDDAESRVEQLRQRAASGPPARRLIDALEAERLAADSGINKTRVRLQAVRIRHADTERAEQDLRASRERLKRLMSTRGASRASIRLVKRLNRDLRLDGERVRRSSDWLYDQLAWLEESQTQTRARLWLLEDGELAELSGLPAAVVAKARRSDAQLKAARSAIEELTRRRMELLRSLADGLDRLERQLASRRELHRQMRGEMMLRVYWVRTDGAYSLETLSQARDELVDLARSLRQRLSLPDGRALTGLGGGLLLLAIALAWGSRPPSDGRSLRWTTISVVAPPTLLVGGAMLIASSLGDRGDLARRAGLAVGCGLLAWRALAALAPDLTGDLRLPGLTSLAWLLLLLTPHWALLDSAARDGSLARVVQTVTLAAAVLWVVAFARPAGALAALVGRVEGLLPGSGS